MNYTATEIDREHFQSYKLMVNDEKVISGLKWAIQSEFKAAIYTEPFGKFQIVKCTGDDFYIAGLTHEITGKLYKLATKNEDAMKVMRKTFIEIVDAISSASNSYGKNMDGWCRDNRYDVSSLCDIYNELYGTNYVVNFDEASKGNDHNKGYEDHNRGEKKCDGKTKVPVIAIAEYGQFMANLMVKEALKYVKKGAKTYDYKKKDTYKLNLPI